MRRIRFFTVLFCGQVCVGRNFAHTKPAHKFGFDSILLVLLIRERCRFNVQQGTRKCLIQIFARLNWLGIDLSIFENPKNDTVKSNANNFSNSNTLSDQQL